VPPLSGFDLGEHRAGRHTRVIITVTYRSETHSQSLLTYQSFTYAPGKDHMCRKNPGFIEGSVSSWVLEIMILR
jgi:hypothetical protein